MYYNYTYIHKHKYINVISYWKRIKKKKLKKKIFQQNS